MGVVAIVKVAGDVLDFSELLLSDVHQWSMLITLKDITGV